MAPEYGRTVRRIVATRPGRSTGETVYVDEYGGTWKTSNGYPIDQTCAPLTGTVEGHYILTSKR